VTAGAVSCVRRGSPCRWRSRPGAGLLSKGVQYGRAPGGRRHRADRGLSRHDETAWLYPPGDVEALRAALERALEDPAGGERIAAAGARWVRRERTWAGNARAVLDVAARVERRVASPAAAGGVA
jgi:hypothetical protein